LLRLVQSDGLRLDLLQADSLEWLSLEQSQPRCLLMLI
jgi:hypothetical protein